MICEIFWDGKKYSAGTADPFQTNSTKINKMLRPYLTFSDCILFTLKIRRLLDSNYVIS